MENKYLYGPARNINGQMIVFDKNLRYPNITIPQYLVTMYANNFKRYLEKLGVPYTEKVEERMITIVPKKPVEMPVDDEIRQVYSGDTITVEKITFLVNNWYIMNAPE